MADDDKKDLSDCKAEAGRVVPVIDRNRCEAKGGCVAVCPYAVFEIRALADADRATLNWRGRIKAWAHGGRQAYVVQPEACRACRRCIDACPEDAIRLEALRQPG